MGKQGKVLCVFIVCVYIYRGKGSNEEPSSGSRHILNQLCTCDFTLQS